MTETQHLSEYGEDDDGFVIATCTCKQFGPFPAPDMETASDAFADHMREVGQQDRQAEIDQHQADWAVVLPIVLELEDLIEDLLICVASDEVGDDAVIFRNRYRPLAARVERFLSTSPTAEEAPNANRDQ